MKLNKMPGLLFVTLFVCNVMADAKVEAGPKGGRILDKTAPRPEFFVEKDGTAVITFYDQQLKPVPARDQMATMAVEGASGRSKIEFEKKGDVLVSKTKLSEDGANLVVQIKESPDARPKNYRFKYETHNCGGCNRAEYACTCAE